MRSIETEGDTIDEAIESALRALAVEREHVEVEILADASRGLLGFGGKKARIRATVRPPLTRIAEAVAATVSRETRKADRPIGADSAGTTAALASEIVTRCEAVARELFVLIGVDARVTVKIGSEPGELIVDVTGDSDGILIGRRGQTLDSLEYLLGRIVSRGDTRPTRLLLDVEGYRQRRQQYLEGLAERLADKVRKTGRTVTLNPMSPRDRRIVHLALQADEAVTTQSQGEGHYRRVLIAPAERAATRRRQTGPTRASDV